MRSQTEGSGQPALIGLVGPKRSGKDTVAGLMVDYHGFARVGFGDAMRAFIYSIDPTWAKARDEFGYEQAKNRSRWFRQRTIEVGTAACETIDSGVWVHAAHKRIALWRHGIGTPVVVPDVRQPNEADYIVDNGGLLVAVERPGFGVDEFPVDAIRADERIFNDGPLVDLAVEVQDLMMQVLPIQESPA